MDILDYDLTIHTDGCDSHGKGTITVKNGPKCLVPITKHHITWQTGGRDCEWTIDEAVIISNDPQREDLDNWTDPLDAVEEELKKHKGYEGEEAWGARVINGEVVWLIASNEVLIGTISRSKRFVIVGTCEGRTVYWKKWSSASASGRPKWVYRFSQKCIYSDRHTAVKTTTGEGSNHWQPSVQGDNWTDPIKPVVNIRVLTLEAVQQLLAAPAPIPAPQDERALALE